MKKGQIELAFRYIFGIIVLAVVIFFGFKAVNYLTSLGEQAELQTFKIDVQKKIDSVYSRTLMSNELAKLRTPKSIVGICFIDFSKPREIVKYKDIEELAAEIQSNEIKIFFSGKAEEPLILSKVKLEKNPLCFSAAKGYVEFELENRGTYVQVK